MLTEAYIIGAATVDVAKHGWKKGLLKTAARGIEFTVLGVTEYLTSKGTKKIISKYEKR